MHRCMAKLHLCYDAIKTAHRLVHSYCAWAFTCRDSSELRTQHCHSPPHVLTETWPIARLQQNVAGAANSADASSAPSAGDAATSWRPKPGAAQASSAASAASAATGSTATQVAAAALPDIKIQRAEDIGRTKWEKSKDLTTAEQGKQKLRGILNKLTPDNFEKLVPQVCTLPAMCSQVAWLHSTCFCLSHHRPRSGTQALASRARPQQSAALSGFHRTGAQSFR